MSDAGKPRGRARGRGRGQSPPPPGEQRRPILLQQSMPRQRMPLQPEAVPVRPGMQTMPSQQMRGSQPRPVMMAQQQRPMAAQQRPIASEQQYQGGPWQQHQGAPRQQFQGAPRQQYQGAPRQQYQGAPPQQYQGSPQQQQPPMMPQQQRPMAPQQQQQQQQIAPQQQWRPTVQQQQQRPMAPQQQQQQRPMIQQSVVYPAASQQPAGVIRAHPPGLQPTTDVRVPLPCQPRTRAPMQLGQQRPAPPGQQATPRQTTPRMPTSRQLAAQEAGSGSTPVSRPDTSQSRAFYRGSERMQAATQRATQASEDAAVATQLGAMALQEGSDGNGNGSGGNGNGNGNGSSAVSVGRGMSRGCGRRLEGTLPVLRPHNNTKIGKGGRGPVKLHVNYFELERCEDWHLYLYDVQYKPEQDDRHQRFQIMEPHLKHFGAHVFDGQAIFSIIRLTNKTATYTSKTDVVYTVNVTMVKELGSLDEQFIRFLNLILRRCQNYIKLKLIGRHYFNTEEAIPLGQELNMRVFPGYQTSIRQHEEKILLNVDIVHKFQHQTTLLAKMHKFSSREERDRELIGQIVMARYNHLTYRVDSIRDDLKPTNTFLFRGNDCSYIDYYREKYGLTITNVLQPLVHCKPSARQMRSGITDIFLVPELLSLTGIPEDMRRNYNQMKMLADYTKMGVDKRVAALKRFNQNLLSNERVREDLAKWGLKLSSNLVTVESRMLEYENVGLERGMTNHPPDSADWTAQCRNQSMAFTVHLKNWVVLVPRRHEQEVGEFITVLQRAARSVGMNLDHPEVVTVSNIGNCEAEISNHAGRQMVMIILDRMMANKYGQLKKRLACQIGVLSQCVQGHNMTKKGVMSIATKIAIQMNAKLGGEPWRISQPAKTAMVVGYDVYHDNLTPNKSYGAVVSSINPMCTRYFGQVNPHHNKEELSDNFSMSIRNAVDQYHRCNNSKYPATLIIYRDGVGEGQMDYVKEHEIPAIKRQLIEFGSEVNISLIFVVVSKRINTRMFAEVNGRLVNPSPGTVLDKVVTLPHWYDFFLVSQKVTQGTVTPTSYNVLEDTTKLTVDQVQRLTYKFTHLYYNWQGTVRVPAPCLYAHKLAYLTGTGTHELPKPKLTDKLWFI